jgi:hypothetical protein
LPVCLRVNECSATSAAIAIYVARSTAKTAR